MKNKRGITLIALVITIIILLILAGITITQLTGNGLFEKTKKAEIKYKNSEILENEILSDYEKSINKYITNNRNNESFQELKIQTGSANVETITKNSGVNINVTLPKEMANTDYIINVNINTSAGNWANCQCGFHSKSTKGFVIRVWNLNMNNDATGIQIEWGVIGYQL